MTFKAQLALRLALALLVAALIVGSARCVGLRSPAPQPPQTSAAGSGAP